ncbi:MAG: hypothetical protein JJU27_10400 [Gammaproteobacteria bacterium]|nr:hypothetical protein [Gammaproteobacteria bacterium]
MQPLSVLIGIILGSAFSIALGLSVVLLLLWVVGQDSPQVAAEREGLVGSIAIFWALTVLAAASFIGQLKLLWWRWPAQLLMWTALVVTGLYYWPD